MGPPTDIHTLSRCFLQARRRGPLHAGEVTRLLSEDAVYVEVVDGEPLTVTGAPHIAELFRRLWAGLAVDTRMQVVRHTVVDDRTAVGHWTRTADGVTVHGRDTMVVEDNKIVSVTVEEFHNARVPELTGTRV